MRFISLRDNATKAPLENYYHGYLNGLFTTALKTFSPNITQIMKQAMVILISPLQILFQKKL